jgi:trehalose 6-phosphate synthase
VLLQVGVPPPRATVRATRLAAALEDAAAAVNARHGREGVPHVRLHLSPVEHGPLMGVLRAAHVALVTPLRDGMNLVAKEFVAAQDPTDPGVLVLSRTAGAAYELDAALQVDPHDTDAVARAIGRACSASLAERLERHGALVESVRRGGPAAWSGAFLARLGARHAPARAPALAPG